jgi:hypothetical protein
MQISTSTGATQRPSLRKASISRRRTRAVAVMTAGALLSVALGGAAQADDLYNTIAGTTPGVAINDKIEVLDFVQGDPAKETALRIQARNSQMDGYEGCNTPKGTSVKFRFESSDTSVAEVETPTLTFDACTTTTSGAAHEKMLRIKPGTAGSATITAVVETLPAPPNGGVGSYRLDTATIKVVVAPPPNNKPTVQVVGVTENARYAKSEGAAPTPKCVSTDVEDGPTEFDPAMSRGEDANLPNGLGVRIATCKYTDSRGDAAEPHVVRYYIVDNTAPVVSARLSKAAPLNGWYRNEVALEWIVNDPESEATLTTDGCDRVWINTDQKNSTYTCTATSAGGTTSVDSQPINYDATPPTVTPTILSTPVKVGEKLWYPARPEIRWDAADATSELAGEAREAIPFASLEGQNMMTRWVATDNAGNTGGTSVQYVNVDASAPVVTAALTGTPAYTDPKTTKAWFKDQATITVTASDPDVQPYERGSGVKDDPTGPHTVTATTSFTATATDNVGHVGTSDTVPVNVDATAPVVKATCPSLPIIKGLPLLKATWTASDEADGSGLKSAKSGSVKLDASKVGHQTVTMPVATDNVGHTSAVATCGYQVVYPFVGFFAPIDNFGVYNKVKAGSAVPVKFSLLGNQGTNVLAGEPVVTQVACPAAMKSDVLEETASAKSPSGLKYDTKTGLYTYTWKTATSFAGTCQKLTVNLADGTSQTALFTFTK